MSGVDLDLSTPVHWTKTSYLTIVFNTQMNVPYRTKGNGYNEGCMVLGIDDIESERLKTSNKENLSIRCLKGRQGKKRTVK